MRKIGLLAALILPVLSATAQFSHGPRVGLAMATQTGGGLEWTGLPKLGPIVGWSFEAAWKRQIFFRLEPMLMSKGSWTRDAVTRTNTYVTHRYIEFPLLVRVDMQPKPDGAFLTAGVIYGYWTYARVRTVVDGEETYDQTSDLDQPNVNRSQWSIAVGFGQQGPRWSYELRIETSVTPFDALLHTQELVFGIHATYRLMSKKEREKRAEAEPKEKKEHERKEKQSDRELSP